MQGELAPPVHKCVPGKTEPVARRVPWMGRNAPDMKRDRAGLQVTLLGGFETRLATGQPVTLSTRKAQALLAYLATRPGQPHARDKLTALLWADRGDTQARHSLRHTLVELRKVLPAPASLIAERRAIVLDTAAIEVDVTRFEACASAGSTAGLAEASDLYQPPPSTTTS